MTLETESIELINEAFRRLSVRLIDVTHERLSPKLHSDLIELFKEIVRVRGSFNAEFPSAEVST